MKCSNCGKDLDNNALICASCGHPVSPETDEKAVLQAKAEKTTEDIPDILKILQEKGDKEVSIDFSEPLSEPAPSVKKENQADSKPNIAKKLSKINNKKTIIGIALAILASIVLMIIVFSGSGGTDESPIMYVNGDSLFIVEKLGSKSAKTFEISDNIAGVCTLTQDNKYLVYGEGSESGFNILYRKVGDEKSEPVTIAKKVDSFITVVGNIDYVIYEKNGDIYKTNRKGESEKLLRNASVTLVSEDGKTLLCSQSKKDDAEEGKAISLVSISSGKTTEISKKADNCETSRNLDKIVFTEGDRLYISNAKGKKEAIDKKISSFTYCEGTDTIYYTKEDKTLKYSDIINDNCKDKDSEKGADKAEADNRNAIREKLDENFAVTYCAYSYKKGKSQKICKDLSKDYVSRITNICNADDEVVFSEKSAYTISDKFSDYVAVEKYQSVSKIKKINIDKIDSVYTMQSDLENHLQAIPCIITPSANIDIAPDDNMITEEILYNPYTSKFVITCKKENVLNDADFDFSGFDYSDFESINKNFTLYELDEKETMKDAKIIAEDIYSYVSYDKDFIFFSDYDSDSHSATMSYGKKKFESIVPKISCDVHGNLYLFTDYDYNTGTCTVKKYKNGKLETIVEEAYQFGVYDGKYVAITDYDKLEGTLICINGKKTYEIDKASYLTKTNTTYRYNF